MIALADVVPSSARELTPGVSINPNIAETTSGPIEYDLTNGTGPVVLSIHGGIGGCDQGRLLANWIDCQRFRILSPSRPGYLGTPLDVGQTMEQQADALVALLDTLGISKVTLLGISTGSPAAYMFAIRHPERVNGLIVIDGVSGRYELPEVAAGPIKQAIFLSESGRNLLQKISDWRQRLTLQSFFEAEHLFTREQINREIDYIMADSQLLEFFRAFLATMLPYQPRKLGTVNDVNQFQLFYSYLPVELIRCPTLIIHGTHDADVKFSDGVYAYEHIPGANRVWIEEGTHLGFWFSPNAYEAQQTARKFLDSCN